MREQMERFCHYCGNALTADRLVGRRETCPSCGRDLHVCLNCSFHEPGAYNDCRETQAERVVSKDRGNFCDFFSFREGAAPSGPGSGKPSARDRLDSLFKK